MTIEQAIKARLYPYTLPDTSIELLAENQGLDWEDDYDKDEHEAICAKIEIEALWQLVTLSKEQDSGSTQEYDPDMLMKRIRRVADMYGIEDEQASANPQNEDITNWW